MAKRWIIHPHDPDRIADLSRSAGIPAVVAQLLVCRKITDPVAAREFLDPKLSALRDPELLPGCLDAARHLHRAIAERQRIVIHGDYDVDGMSGTALLWLCLKLLGADVGYYVPHRVEEGYGLSNETVRTLASQKTRLIVTVDCGINSREQTRLAKELGMEVIITDHHEPDLPLPEAAAIVHPRLPGSAYPFGGLSGSGVAMKVAWALCQLAAGGKRVSEPMKELLMQAVGLAALGTVADVVPLVDENRVLVKQALVRVLPKQPTLGLAALMRIAKIEGKSPLDSEDIGFALAPRLNAAGRLGQPQLAVELLITDRPDRAEELARYIDQLNADRQSLERSIYLAANKQIKEHFDPEENPALVLADRGWHAGVIGIVAGRLVEKHHRPVVLISWDQLGIRPGIGSARSVPGFNLHAALCACGHHLVSHGGHAAAAGLKILEANLDLFRTEFCEHAAGEISADTRLAELAIDAEVPLSAFTIQTVRQIEQLSPFGQGNPRPVMCTSDVTLVEPPKTIGGGDRHLAMRLSQHGVTLRAVCFGGGERKDELANLSGPLEVAFRPVINSFRGYQSVELQVVDWRPQGAGR